MTENCSYVLLFYMSVKYLCCVQNVHLALKVRSQYTAMMVKEVRDVLSELLGGLNYLQSGVHSQYHYYLG